MLSLQPCFGNASADSFAEDLMFEGRKHREQPGHGATLRGSIVVQLSWMLPGRG
jgi:hypothetical protein